MPCTTPAGGAPHKESISPQTRPNRLHTPCLLIQAPCTLLRLPLSLPTPDLTRATRARPLHPAALAFVPFGIVLVRVRVRQQPNKTEKRERIFDTSPSPTEKPTKRGSGTTKQAKPAQPSSIKLDAGEMQRLKSAAAFSSLRYIAEATQIPKRARPGLVFTLPT